MYILYALGSAVFASLVAIFGKIGLKDIDSTFATTVRAIIMAAFLFLVSLIFGKFKGFSFETLGSKAWLFVALSGIAGALSWLCYFYAVKYGPVIPVVAIDKLSIVFAAILAIIFLSESVTFYKIAGVSLIALGAFLTTL
jgi:bacterial/archaeal transporter family protein